MLIGMVPVTPGLIHRKLTLIQLHTPCYQCNSVQCFKRSFFGDLTPDFILKCITSQIIVHIDNIL